MYVLCLLVFIACSDDENGHKEDSGMSDFEKPFSNLSSDELSHIMEASFPACRDLIADYAIHIFDQRKGLLTRFSFRDLYLNLTPAKYVWNRDKQGFDTLVNTADCIEFYCPFSATDDSQNDLYVVFKYDKQPAATTSSWKYYKDGELIYSSEGQVLDTISRTKDISGPYVHHENIISKRKNTSVIMEEHFFQKEGVCQFLDLSREEYGEKTVLMEYNTVRVRAKYKQYDYLKNMAETLDRKDKSYNKTMTDLYNANMEDAIVVFTNCDEKIGDLIMVDFNYQAFRSIYGCKMKDGTVFNFTINLYANEQ